MKKIRSLEIDFDRGILKINGESITDRPVDVELPGPDGWPLRKLFNAGRAAGNPEKYDKLKITYERMINSKP